MYERKLKNALCFYNKAGGKPKISNCNPKLLLLLIWVASVWFYSISSIVGYLMPGPFSYI